MSPRGPVLIHGRRGAAIAGVLAAAQLGVLGSWRAWAGTWAATEAYLGDLLVFTAPAAAGVAAWVVASGRRRGLDPLAAAGSRPQWRVHTRAVAEAWAWSAAGVAAGSLAPMAWTAAEAAYGGPRIWPWLPIVASLFLASALGAWAGRLLPPPIAPPLAAASLYAVLVLMVFRADDVLAALTPLDGRGMALFTVPWWVYGLQAALLAVAGLAVALRAAGARQAAWRAAFVAGLLAAPLLHVGAADRRVDEAATRIECGDDRERVVVCMPVAKAHLIDDAQRFAAELWPLLAGLAPEHTLLVNDEARDLSPFANAEIARVSAVGDGDLTSVFHFSNFGDLSAYTQVSRDGMLTDLARILIPHASREEAGARAVTTGTARPREIVLRWLLTELDVPIDGSAKPGAPILDGSFSDFEPVAAQLDWFAGLSPAERRAWFAAHRDAIASGTLTLDVFGP